MREGPIVNRAAEYWPYGLIGVAIIAAILNIALYAAGVVESFLLWFLVVVVGFGSLYALWDTRLSLTTLHEVLDGPPEARFNLK